jgi:hypothetical protein
LSAVVSLRISAIAGHLVHPAERDTVATRGRPSIAFNPLGMQLADVLHSLAALAFMVGSGLGLIIVDRLAQRTDQFQNADVLHLP